MFAKIRYGKVRFNRTTVSGAVVYRPGPDPGLSLITVVGCDPLRATFTLEGANPGHSQITQDGCDCLRSTLTLDGPNSSYSLIESNGPDFRRATIERLSS